MEYDSTRLSSVVEENNNCDISHGGSGNRKKLLKKNVM